MSGKKGMGVRPPDKGDEPDKRDEGEGSTQEAASPDEPAAAGGDGQGRSSDTLPEEPSAADTSREPLTLPGRAADEAEREPEGERDILPEEPAVSEPRDQSLTSRDEAADRAERETPSDAESRPDQQRDTIVSAHGAGEEPEAGDGGRADPALAEDPKQSEPAADRERAPRPSSPPPARSGGGFLSALLAAVIGGLIGAGGVWYYLQQQEPRGPDPEIVAALEQQERENAARSEQLAAIEEDIASLNEALSATDISDEIEQLQIEAEGRFEGVAEALAAAAERLDRVEARVAQADEQIAELEARPIADPDTATEVLRSEIAEMRDVVEQATQEARAQVERMRADLSAAASETQEQIIAAEQRAAELEAQAQERIRAAEAEAEALARAAQAEAALARIEAALDSGEPFQDALQTLRENADTQVSQALASVADTGVPTIAELRETFPDAAREALRATAVARTEGDPADRLVAFLRTHTQARSLTPREGDSPDAILSRAEAALEEGNVSAALVELEALPEDGRAAMQEWIDDARRRADAVEAAASLRQTMN